MFSLIFWENTKEISVLPSSDVKTLKNKTKAKWGGQWFSALVLKTSQQRDWLESLDVSSEGKIITPEKRSSISSDLLLKKRQDRLIQKGHISSKRNAEKFTSEAILKSKSIFERNNIEDQSNDDCEENDTSNQEYESKCNDGINQPIDCQGPAEIYEFEDSSNEQDSSRPTTHEKDHVSNSSDDKSTNTSAERNSCICSKFPSVTKENLVQLQSILNLANSIYLEQNKDKKEYEIFEIKSNFNKKNNKQVELIEGTNVYVDSYKLACLQSLHAKRPRELVRQLMKLILGEEVLKKSSPTGKNGWKPIPTDIYEAVERYVNENAPKSKYQISMREYREVLTSLCATLRSQKDAEKSEKRKKDKHFRKKEDNKSDTEDENHRSKRSKAEDEQKKKEEDSLRRMSDF